MSRYLLNALWSLALLLGTAPPVAAQWMPGGIQIPGSRSGTNARVIVDYHGGILTGWLDTRTYSTTDYDVYGQHLTSAGTLAAGCPSGGIPACTTTLAQYFNSAASDAQGGEFLGWSEFRIHGGGYTTPCAQRVTSSGLLAPGWPADGVALSTLGTSHGGPQIAPDGSGGAFFFWEDMRNDATGNGSDVYAQHMSAGGTVVPGWPVSGLPIAAYPGDQLDHWVFTDGVGGMIALWDDYRPGASGIYMQHIQGDGTLAPGWPAGGVNAVPNRGAFGVAQDGSGGFFLGLGTARSSNPDDALLYLAHVTASAQTAPGWPAAGKLVCNAAGLRNGPQVTADAAGRAYMTWDDYRGGGASRIYAVQLLPDATFPPGWVLSGNPVTTFPGYQFTGEILADQSGGLFVSGVYDGAGSEYGFMQHLSASGTPAPGWDAAGQQLNPHSHQTNPRVASDGAGGAIVVWENRFDGGLYAQHYPGDGATATLLSLVSATAQPDRVALLWQGDAALTASASVERRSFVSDWQDIGAPVLDGSDRLRYEDRDVAPSSRYAYRLRYSLGGTERTTSETWVDVPGVAQLSLAGLRPNPARGSDLHVSFSLPDAGPARLELIDVAGRRVATRDVGALGAGTHVEPLQTDSKVPAGLYWLRLTQGNRSLVTRAVVTG